MAQCKYAMREHQISYDDGFSWVSLEVIKGDLIEYQSADCPDSGSEITKWVDLDGDYICEDNRKYKKQVLYVSYDGGATWYIYFPTIYQKGEYVGIDNKFCNNKFEGHYESGGGRDPLKIVKCNNNVTLTSGETNYYIGGYALISAKIGKCVGIIGERAFYGYDRLSTITIPSGISIIEDSAFYYCNGLQSIIVEAITPPTLGAGVFPFAPNFTIYVPCSSVSAYKSATRWGNYANRIQPISTDCYQYRTLTTGTTCVGLNKYTLAEYQVSIDGGETWITTATSATTLIEVDSEDCGYEPPDYSTQYLTFVALEDYAQFQVVDNWAYYSLNSGQTWTLIQSRHWTPSISTGEKIMWRKSMGDDSSSNVGSFTSTKKFNAEGNIMSLVYSSNFSGQTSLGNRTYTFSSLFDGCKKLINAKNLVLPVTTLTNYCYANMFMGCSSLTTAPQLPSTTLALGCYYQMFYRCTSLQTAPQLPALTLADKCYEYIFDGCTSLAIITCLATDISANLCTNMWVNDVFLFGTFYKNPSMTSWGSGMSGIPTNWTILDYQE